MRDMTEEDAEYLFLLNSNEEVQKFCEKRVATHINEARAYISNILQQYQTNGIGRWLVFTKETNEFLGWAGLKIEKNVNNHESFVDLGYRILPQFWNKGYMTEAAAALVRYGFEERNYDVICGYVTVGHESSAKVLMKAGLKYVETFRYDEEEEDDWYELSREDYYRNIKKSKE